LLPPASLDTQQVTGPRYDLRSPRRLCWTDLRRQPQQLLAQLSRVLLLQRCCLLVLLLLLLLLLQKQQAAA
jgi:hypothetical protein